MKDSVIISRVTYTDPDWSLKLSGDREPLLLEQNVCRIGTKPAEGSGLASWYTVGRKDSD